MANQILFKRGLETNRSGITPAQGEPIWTTDTNQLYVGDGTTAGGIAIGAGSMSNWSITADSGGPDTISDGETLDIAGGTGITTVYATNTVTINHDSHTGDVTGSTALTIANDAVTYAKMQNVVSDNVLLGNNSGAGGIVDELTATEVRTLLNVEDGADNGSGVYLPLTGGTVTGPVTFTNNVTLNDNDVLQLGTGADIKVFFSGTEAFVELESVDLTVRNSTDTALFKITHSTGQVDVSNDLVVGGDLTVNGTTTTVNTETISLADNIITLNSDYTGPSPTENAGIEVERGSQTNATLRWNETSDYWEIDKANGSFFEIITTDNVASSHNHDGTYLKIADIDDVPVNAATDTAISSNWAYDHENGADPHSVYPLLAGTESITGTWTFTNATFDGGTF